MTFSSAQHTILFPCKYEIRPLKVAEMISGNVEVDAASCMVLMNNVKGVLAYVCTNFQSLIVVKKS